ncbi:MAG TPA: rhodanese-like domain-containing protein [Bacteroidota bacterium]|nr:rhodanese-like domain-containing protein [Bacteroidota bacterium]
MKNLFRESLMIVIIAAGLAFVYNAVSPKSVPLIRTKTKSETVSDSALFPAPASSPKTSVAASSSPAMPQDTVGPNNVKVIAPLHDRALARKDSLEKAIGKKNEPVYKIITLDQLKRLLEQKRGILFDARNDDEYRKGHIKGARNIPALDAGKHFVELAVIPRDTLVLIYCSNSECPLGRSLAEFLGVMEFKNIYLYDDGWDGWQKAGMPVDTTIVGDQQ